MQGIRYIGEALASGRQITDVVFAAANPDPARYVAAAGQTVLASAYPRAASLPHVLGVDVGPPISPVAVGLGVRPSGRQIGELLAFRRSATGEMGFGGLHFSSDSGATWAERSFPNLAAIFPQWTLGVQPRRWDIVWDPVEAAYLLFVSAEFRAAGQATPFVGLTALRSTDLLAWELKFSPVGLFDEAGAGFAAAVEVAVAGSRVLVASGINGLNKALYAVTGAAGARQLVQVRFTSGWPGAADHLTQGEGGAAVLAWVEGRGDVFLTRDGGQTWIYRGVGMSVISAQFGPAGWLFLGRTIDKVSADFSAFVSLNHGGARPGIPAEVQSLAPYLSPAQVGDPAGAYLMGVGVGGSDYVATSVDAANWRVAAWPGSLPPTFFGVHNGLVWASTAQLAGDGGVRPVSDAVDLLRIPNVPGFGDVSAFMKLR
mgnify:CR=1 FL=1